MRKEVLGWQRVEGKSLVVGKVDNEECCWGERIPTSCRVSSICATNYVLGPALIYPKPPLLWLCEL